MDAEVQNSVLPFLRLAALLQSALYEIPLPNAKPTPRASDEFHALCRFLELKSDHAQSHLDCASYLAWISDDSITLIGNWSNELTAFAGRAQIAARVCLRTY